ncbi:thiol reductant ABC exporter subunit CydC [Paenibacillus sp. IB182496]|uniref:Thiol reductant ABC exporter subunit CydC n=1 Tax=Paenibacillus sabuli TaxID=2772509 RepID=A0A927BU29_9BACL|nr:thiol reductant ABC exporter subunit CydC [Paenibacillus sabuli]MBD2845408.1 thiol reductant ABC exporter subunit CydC [Paenibacillus sabuli]
MSEWTVLGKAMLRERRDIAIAIAGGFLAGAGGVGLFAASGYMVSRAAFAPPLYTLIVLTSLVKILGLLRAGSRYGERLYTHRATFSILSRLRVDFFKRLVPLAPAIFRRSRSGDLLARVVGDVESLQHFFLRVAYPPLVLAMVFLATILFASAYSLTIAGLLVLGLLAAAVLVPALVMRGQRARQRRVRLQRAALSTDMTELLYGYRDLKVYGQAERRERALHEAAAELATAQRASGLNLLRGQTLHALVTHGTTWAVLAAGAYLIAGGALAGIYLAMLVLIAFTVFEEAAAVATLPAYKQDSEHAAQRLAETVTTDDRIEQHRGAAAAGGRAAAATARGATKDTYHDAAQDPAGAAAPAAAPLRELDAGEAGPPMLELRDVTFRYADAWRPALDGASLRIAAGSKTAIVGPSGAGKTTVLELLLKLYLPQQGEVSLGGAPTGCLHDASIWRASRVVLQRNHFFRGTIRDNLLAADVHTSDEAMRAALEDAQLGAVPLDDPVLEQAENLSDGEKQRLALARAMLRRGRLWLLDEPTSALDAVTEARIVRRLFERARGDTLVWIGHRLAGLERMDQILVLDRGRVAESGSYDELMARRGAFYAMKQIEQDVVGQKISKEGFE